MVVPRFRRCALAARSLAARAVLAVLLMIGFYLLALAIAGLLLFLPYAEMRWANRIHPQIALFCIAGAGIVLWSAFPKRDPFKPPGPLLERDAQPRLFGLIDGLAKEAGQEEPHEVYLVHDVNAWVSQRGGFPGFGGRRVMGIGLPVLQFLTVSEIKAVLAHEYGHFHGGDTQLGVFIYQTRAGIERTIQGLASAGGRLASLQGPFVAYGRFFLRTTEEISRAQESAADALAARIAGPRALIEALKKIRVNALAYQPYLNTEFSPAVGMGLLPPIAEGFRNFMESPDIRRQVEERFGDIVEFSRKEMAERDPDEHLYDSHPPLPARIEALAALGLPDPPGDDRLAITLLDDVPALDARLSRAILIAEVAARSKDTTWQEVSAAYVENYRSNVAAYTECFGHLPAEELAANLAGIEADMLEVQKRNALPGWDDEPDARKEHVRWLAGGALALAAIARGYTAFTLPGWPVVVRGPRGEFDPFALVRRIEEGELTDPEWRAECSRLGLDGAILGDVSN